MDWGIWAALMGGVAGSSVLGKTICLLISRDPSGFIGLLGDSTIVCSFGLFLFLFSCLVFSYSVVLLAGNGISFSLPHQLLI